MPLLILFRLDSGIYVQHTDFKGRAIWGGTFGDYESKDLYGHGTAVASIAGGKYNGLADASTLIACKIYDSPADGRSSNAIAAIEWIVKDAEKEKSKNHRENIVILGFNDSSPHVALSDAVTAAILSGVHFAGPAGNLSQDASKTFPGQSE
jgi:cerevisin